MKLNVLTYVVAFVFSLSSFAQSTNQSKNLLNIEFKTVVDGKFEKVILHNNNVIYQRDNAIVSYTIPQLRLDAIRGVVNEIKSAEINNTSDVASVMYDNSPLITSLVIKNNGKVLKTVFNEVNPPQELRNILAIIQDFTKQ